jgi:hypothetical protein
MGMNIAVNSTLGALVIISLLGWLGGTYFTATNPAVGAQIVSISRPIFLFSLFIWFVFIVITIVRNVAKM